jgi:hypothetical protein
MNVLGLDIGFSITKATNCFCLLYVDEELKEIGLEAAPIGGQLFAHENSQRDCTAF